ncbi:PQQ-binding-like beta-propeller repeat protein [Cellvibrio sp. UBA7671]|uniref:outer membrane protein assembly factor BamB family protein n=1 Tax=Cellvibrio sp. UBA7671 TaxID=1946312 RepID=UPI002F34F19E
MSGSFSRIFLSSLLSLALVACGGGGGGGGSKPTPPVDTDGDGYADTRDAFPSDPKEWLDTDKDGVGDNGDAFPNDATETKDTDKDGVGDNKDAFPSDASETVDTDKDGKGDNADPDPLGQAIPAWPTHQGNSHHNGYVDVTLAPANFKTRWEKPIELASLNQGAAGDGYIFFNNAGQLYAVDARTGTTLWTQSIAGTHNFSVYNPPAYADGIVYVQTGGHADAFLWAFNSADGRLLFKTQLEDQWSNHYAPTVVDNIVYIGGGYYGGMYAIDAKTGAQKWWQTLNQTDQFTPAVSGDYAIAYTSGYSPRLTVANKTSGNVAFEIDDPDAQHWGGGMNLAPVVAGDLVLANHAGRVVAFNLASKTRVWQMKAEFSGDPVIRGEHFYIVNNTAIEVRKLSDGSLVSSIPGAATFTSNLVLTNNLLFVSDNQNTYAYQVDSGALAWTLNGVKGKLLAAEGALVVFGSTGIVTLDLEGDIDIDGLPDWWEKRLKKNVNATGDSDNDGLTGLQEFALMTNPNLADTDSDGLTDGEEVTAKSAPLIADSDADGLLDGAEVKTHNSAPDKADSDEDGLTDGEEVAAGLNPTNSADALQDSDGDGYSNLHEVHANTSISDANQRPEIANWSMPGGTSMGNNYIPLLLDESKFSERWSKTSPVSLATAPVATSQRLVARINNQYQLWDTGTGQETGTTAITNNGLSLPASSGDKLVFLSQSTNSGTNLQVFNANSGASLLNKELSSAGYLSVNQPLVRGNTLYLANSSRSFKAYNLDTGDLLWTSGLSNGFFATDWRPLVSAKHLVGLSSNTLVVYSAQDGTLLRNISLPANSYLQTTVLGSRDNILMQLGGTQLASVSLTDGSNQWSNSSCNSAKLALGNGKVYALTEQKLCVLDEQTGRLLWEMPVSNSWQGSNPVLTANHLFYSDSATTYAIDLRTRQVIWSINKPARYLAMDDHGTLFIQDTFALTAIDTLGDTDADGILQWWERRYGGNLQANADEDADGLTNLDEFTAKTSPLLADTDGDGLNDGLEVNTHQTSPINSDTDNDGLSDSIEVNTHATNPRLGDSDSDGMDDSLELDFGLNPNANDAAADADSDGFNNRDEIYAGTLPNSAASKPTPTDWVPRQGNAAHNAFQPYSVNAANFNLRWSKSFNQYLKPMATGSKSAFLIYGDKNLVSLNAIDGSSQWQQNLGDNNRAPGVAYMDEKVILSTNAPNALQAFAADTGASLFSASFSSYNSADYTPSLFGNRAYTSLGYSSGIVAKDLASGATLWSTANLQSTRDIAVNNAYVFAVSNRSLVALDRATGSEEFRIDIQGTSAEHPVLGTRNNLLLEEPAASGQLLVNYSIAKRSQTWSKFTGQIAGHPVAGNGRVYFINNGQLQSLSELNGELLWSWQPTNQYLNSNILVTYSHVFVSSESKTYALSATNGELLWTYDAGGQLALGADGALYIQGSITLTAINLEGDSDGDAMPDWWERHYNLNPASSSDTNLDKDGDGLTNLQEFNRKTYADDTDSDNDQLSDSAEIGTHNTDPLASDSDNDGMPDGWEVANSLNPRSAADRDIDSDGDTVPNYFEYAQETNPNNALSLPAFFSPGQFSFEDSQLPSGWSLSNETTDVSISLGVASHGTKALQARNFANIQFTGFFAASDLSLDIRYGCSGSTGVEVYIDGSLQARVQSTGEWSTLKTLIPLGQHTVSIRTNSYNCSVYLDNVVIAAAKTNAEMGVQFASTSNNNIQFYDIKGTLKRELLARLPDTNSSLRGIATIGNDYLVVAFGSNPTHLGLLNLATFDWRYVDGLEAFNSIYSYGNYALAATGSVVYLASVDPFNPINKIARVDLLTGAVDYFGAHTYNSIALDSQGFIYAHANYTGVVYKYDPVTLALVSEIYVARANQIMIDQLDRLVVFADNNEILRYNAQRLVEARLELPATIYSMSTNSRGDLFLNTQNNTLLHYSPDWQRVKSLAITANYMAGFPQADSDSDQIPDWWEQAYGLAANNASDASSDTDSDGLTALEEFNADTNPANPDTDGDLLNDGDEVEDYATDPNKQDSDGDGLSDAEELLDHQSNPLKADSDDDLINDYLEIVQYHTDPMDANSKPAALSNFVESFESGSSGWIQPTGGADAGWSVVSSAASLGSKSLRAGAIGENQTAEVEWTAVYTASTLSFDARVSAEYCCDYLLVYLDDVAMLDIRTNESWQTHQVNIPAGVHTLRFVYRKDGSGISGEDSAWIDNIRVD